MLSIVGRHEAALLTEEGMNRRAIRVLEQLGEKPSVSIPTACGGWAETQAAYRFFDNEKVTADAVLAPHAEATLVRCRQEAVVLCVDDTTELFQWYLCRWDIEVFFRVLKSGCEVEELQLERTERLEAALGVYLIVAWRVLFLMRLGRTCPDLSCEVVFTPEEWQTVYMVAKRKPPPKQPLTLNQMIRLVATFGGFLGRKGDDEPGPKSLWIGLQRMRDFVAGALWARPQGVTCV